MKTSRLTFLVLFLFVSVVHAQDSSYFIDAIEGVQDSTGGDFDHFTLEGMIAMSSSSSFARLMVWE